MTRKLRKPQFPSTPVDYSILGRGLRTSSSSIVLSWSRGSGKCPRGGGDRNHDRCVTGGLPSPLRSRPYTDFLSCQGTRGWRRTGGRGSGRRTSPSEGGRSDSVVLRAPGLPPTCPSRVVNYGHSSRRREVVMYTSPTTKGSRSSWGRGSVGHTQYSDPGSSVPGSVTCPDVIMVRLPDEKTGRSGGAGWGEGVS